jgi:hypothetical protein
MRYMLLIYTDPTVFAAMSQEALGANFAAYMQFNQETGARGVLRSGEALQPATTATTLRIRDGKSLTTDGPFAETKEHLGGFYILDCKDLDEAIEFAAKIPDAVRGSIEIRPIAELNQ